MSTAPAPVPRWLELQAEIDYRLFLLGEIQRYEDNLTPIDQMVDAATGHDQARHAEAGKIIAEIKTLKAEWDALEEQR